MNEYSNASKKLKALNKEYLSHGESVASANKIVNLVKNEYIPSSRKVILCLWLLMFAITLCGTYLAAYLEVEYFVTQYTNVILSITWSLSGIVGILIGIVSIKREKDLIAYKEIQSDYL